MLRGRLGTWLLLLLALALLVLGSTRLRPIGELRQTHQLDPYDPQRDSALQADLRVPTVALSMFRSVVIDYLWIRADNLKQEGQYFDALHLARAMCALQPNLPSVWIFNAWNMAYNISVGLPTYPERWHWVAAGFTLLRDEALAYNRRDLEIYRELGWIFQHKIGGLSDDANRYYKLRLAREMMPLLGRADNEDFFALAEAPREWGQPSCPPITEADLLDAAGILARLQAQADPVARFLHARLMDKHRERLAQVDLDQPLGDDWRRLLAIELNRACVAVDVYDEARFAGVNLSDETQALLALNPQGFDQIRRNRLLLEDYFAGKLQRHESYRLDSDVQVRTLMERCVAVEEELADRDKLLSVLIGFMIDPGSFPPPLHQVMSDYRGTPALTRLYAYARARVLRNEWKLEPLWMVIANRLYGPYDLDNAGQRLPLDWRSPFAHSLYWALRGLEFAEPGEYSRRPMNLYRMLYHSLQELFHFGRMRIYAVGPPPEATARQAGQELLEKDRQPELRLNLSQDLRMFPVAYQATLDLLDAMAKAGEGRPVGATAGSENLGKSGVVNFYLTGYRKLAQQYFEQLRRRFPAKDTYQVSLEEFVRAEMREQIESIGPKHATNYVNALLRDSFARYALQDDENAAISEAMAQQIHERYNAEFVEPETDRVMMPSFMQMKLEALSDFFNDARMDPALQGGLKQRLQIEQPDLYDRVLQRLEQMEQRSAPSARPAG